MNDEARHQMEYEYFLMYYRATYKVLMNEFHISKSTAERDVTLLQTQYYIPLESKSGRGGGIYLPDSFRRPSRNRPYNERDSRLLSSAIRHEHDAGHLEEEEFLKSLWRDLYLFPLPIREYE